jgi:hypothetical protein
MKKIYKTLVIIFGIGAMVAGFYIWQQNGFSFPIGRYDNTDNAIGVPIYLFILGLALIVYGILFND